MDLNSSGNKITVGPSCKNLSVILFLGIMGLAISTFQTKQFFELRGGLASMHSICDLSATFDCTAVEMSKYAELTPSIPLSQVAIAGYLMIIFYATLGFFERLKKNTRLILPLLTGISLFFAFYSLWLMLVTLKKTCLFCVILDILNGLLFLASIQFPLRLSLKDRLLPLGLQFLATGIVALGLSFGVSHVYNIDPPGMAEALEQEYQLIINTPPVVISVPDDAPQLGPKNAPITLLKFSDYQCPSCKLAAQSDHALIKRYPTQIRIVFLNFPLGMACNKSMKEELHESACEAAAVAICAAQQGYFGAAYEALYENQDHFAEGSIAELLQSIPGLNINQVRECLSQTATQSKIQRDLEFGSQLNVHVTPTYFINGKKVDGGLPPSLWIRVIDTLLGTAR